MRFIEQHLKRNGSFYWVLAIIIFHFVNNLIWCSSDWVTIEDDMCTHLQTHLFFYSQIKKAVISDLGLVHIFSTIAALMKSSRTILYPPLVYFVSAFVNIVFGTAHIMVTRLTHMIYFAILISSVYCIGKTCFDKKGGIIAALLVSFFPGVLGASRLYTLDLPLTSFTALAIYCLIKTKYFSDFRRSIIFGVILGLGIMVKGQILLFLVGPIGYVLVKSLFKRDRNNSEKFICARNCMLALLIAGISSFLWLWPRFNVLLDRFLFLLYGVINDPKVPVMKLDVLSWNWLLSYVYFALNNVSPVLFGLFLLGLFSSVKAQFKFKGIIISWIAVSYCILSLFSMKTDRYFMPALPAIALITIVFFDSIKNKVFQKRLLAATVGFAIFQAMFLSYSPRSHDITVQAQRSSIFYFITPMHKPEIAKEKEDYKNFFLESPCVNPHKSNIESIAVNIFNDLAPVFRNKAIDVGIALEYNTWNAAFSLKYVLKTMNSEMKIFQISKNKYYPLLIERDRQTYNSLKKNKYDYLIALQERGIVNDNLQGLVAAPLSDLLADNIGNLDKYYLKNQYKVLPEGYNVFLFKRKYGKLEI